MLLFLKLGGSLITHKDKPFTARVDVIKRLADEIHIALTDNPNLQLIIGHGSGSFGHVAAKEFGTRYGVQTPEQWKGFLEVWKAARVLNEIVMNFFYEARLPVISFSPSSSAISMDHRVANWQITPIQKSIMNGLIPVVHGDVVFDMKIGGSILSTEELFLHLAIMLSPNKILIAGIDQGVWEDFPLNTSLIETIHARVDVDHPSLKGSHAPDVTGGMAEKVAILKQLVIATPTCQAMIFSGEQDGNVLSALKGDVLGTTIRA